MSQVSLPGHSISSIFICCLRSSTVNSLSTSSFCSPHGAGLPNIWLRVCDGVCVSVFWIYYTTSPAASPADRSEREEKKKCTHSSVLCSSSNMTSVMTLTRFLHTLNKTPITPLEYSNRFAWGMRWMCVCVHVFLCGKVVCLPYCINHLTQTDCWPWIYASVRGSRWQRICPHCNGWYTERTVIQQICCLNGSGVVWWWSWVHQWRYIGSRVMDGALPRVEHIL